MERCLTALLRADPSRPEESIGDVTLADLPADEANAAALLRRRARPRIVHGTRRFGDGRPRGPRLRTDDVPLALRRARSTRISIDGNAHFCRGLLRTRYGHDDEAAAGQSADPTFIPLSALRPA